MTKKAKPRGEKWGRKRVKEGEKQQQQQQMAGGCNRQIRFAAAATVGELWFYFYDNIKLNHSRTGLCGVRQARRVGERRGGSCAAWQAGNQHKVVDIKNIRPHNKNAVSQRKCQARQHGKAARGKERSFSGHG